MKRFMGMMPKNEIKIEKKYEDDFGFSIIVQAGEHGWSILYADGSATYDDIDNTSEDNLKLALKELSAHIYSFKEIKIIEISEAEK